MHKTVSDVPPIMKRSISSHKDSVKNLIPGGCNNSPPLTRNNSRTNAIKQPVYQKNDSMMINPFGYN